MLSFILQLFNCSFCHIENMSQWYMNVLHECWRIHTKNYKTQKVVEEKLFVLEKLQWSFHAKCFKNQALVSMCSFKLELKKITFLPVPAQLLHHPRLPPAMIARHTYLSWATFYQLALPCLLLPDSLCCHPLSTCSVARRSKGVWGKSICPLSIQYNALNWYVFQNKLSPPLYSHFEDK